MNNTNERRNRKSNRLCGYDYSSNGYYFITICTRHRENVFGNIIDGEMCLNQFGQIAHNEWFESTEIRDEIELDEFIIMPNHIHGIVIIRRVDRPVCRDDRPVCRGDRPVCRGDRPVAPTGLVAHNKSVDKTINGPKPKSIGAMIAGYKSAVTKRINSIRQTPGKKIWQRNYYDHIIRDEDEYDKITEYIVLNPKKWEKDDYHQDNKKCQTLSGKFWSIECLNT